MFDSEAAFVPDWPEELVLELTDAAYAELSDEEWNDSLPTGLESLPLGAIALVLSRIVPTALPDADRARYLAAAERVNAAGAARTLAGVHALADSYAALDLEEMADSHAGAVLEMRAALRWTRRAAESELALADDLIVRIPAVYRALSEGRIDRRRAAVFARYTAHLGVAHARQVVESLLQHAHRWTTGQLIERIRRACVETDPASHIEQRRTAHAARRFVSWAEPDGTLSILLSGLDPVSGQGIVDRVGRLARELKTGVEQRTADQLRADVAADLLAGVDVGPLGKVHLTVDLETLAGLMDGCGDLAGYGPVASDIARQVATDLDGGSWTWAVTRPGSGAPIATGVTRRRPIADQARAIRSTHPTCVAPGCRMPAAECDLDHTEPWHWGGPTEPGNLAPLCRHDHTTRHRTGWSYARLPDGDHRWTSPLGPTYTTTGR
ncbi:MAG TPA: DUF222 domain-containing protein, partial [Acidimicrobiia bacterium]|nr:DUF222 domain-containing protein [Acidimicrobiia bacterium]